MPTQRQIYLRIFLTILIGMGAAMGMGYVPCVGESVDQVLGSTYEIEVAGTRVRAEASLKPFYDPKSERVKV